MRNSTIRLKQACNITCIELLHFDPFTCTPASFQLSPAYMQFDIFTGKHDSKSASNCIKKCWQLGLAQTQMADSYWSFWPFEREAEKRDDRVRK